METWDRKKMLPLIFSDLDGTLLDHDDYSFTAAGEALEKIRIRGYPLILNSSKTRTEMLVIQEQLSISFPFICENGAAVFTREEEGLSCQAFSEPRAKILEALHDLRERGYRFTGFNDWSIDEITAMTGLAPDAASRAAEREFTEPILWQSSEDELVAFREALSAKNLRAVQGGRFLSIMGNFDKSVAMRWLINRYAEDVPVTVIALGDSPNDAGMLNVADIAVVIKSERSDEIALDGPEQVYRTVERGPAGWQWAMERILEPWK